MSTAVFAGTDSTTTGDWISAGYGSLGRVQLEDFPSVLTLVNAPPVGTVTLDGTTTPFNYAANVSHVSVPGAPRRGDSSGYDEVAWYNSAAPSPETFTFTPGDSVKRRIRVYVVDYDASFRSVSIVVKDGGGATLDTQAATPGANGAYLAWDCVGTVQFAISETAGPNATVAGIYFDAAPVVGGPLLYLLHAGLGGGLESMGCF